MTPGQEASLKYYNECLPAFVTILALSACCGLQPGCAPVNYDVILRRDLVGTWRAETSSGYAELTLQPDGALSGVVRGRGVEGAIMAITTAMGGGIEGTWTVADRTLVLNVTSLSSNPAFKLFYELLNATDESLGLEGIKPKPQFMRISSLKNGRLIFESGKTWNKVR